METDVIVLSALITLMGGALGTVFWSRLNRLEASIANMATKDDIANMVTRDDLAAMATKADIANMVTRDDPAGMATKADIANMVTKDDIVNMATKDDIAAIRSDLIKVALAVGAERPTASEG